MSFTTRHDTLIASSLLAASLILGARAVAADATLAQAEQQAAPAPISDVSDTQIKSFVIAQERVTEISQKWQDTLSGQETEPEMREVQEKARREMVIAVQNVGLSLQEYNQIAMAAQNDKGLQDRIRAQMSSG